MRSTNEDKSFAHAYLAAMEDPGHEWAKAPSKGYGISIP